jgi:neutral trehalase
MIFQGLQDYGYHTEARELARRLFDMAVVKNPVLREYYNAETGDGLGQTQVLGIYGAVLRDAAGVGDGSTTRRVWSGR